MGEKRGLRPRLPSPEAFARGLSAPGTQQGRWPVAWGPRRQAAGRDGAEGWRSRSETKQNMTR